MCKTRGLILGKFAPFHVGHRRLLEAALNEVDEVYVLIYDCPNLTSIPLNVRANWIRSFFPQVHVFEGWDAPNLHEDTPEVKRIQEEYVKKVLNGERITHFFSSEYYGEHMSKSLGAIDRRFDRNDPEQGYITTATTIRSGKCLDENFLNVVVYKDILINVAFIGMPSQEQSRLVRCVAKKLKTTLIKDNTFELLSRKQKKMSMNRYDFYEIANEKYKLANTSSKIFSGKEYLIYNSIGFVDHLLSIAMHKKFNEKLCNFFSEDLRSYDLIFVNENPRNSICKTLNINDSIFFNQLISNLNVLGIKYQVLVGTFEDKLSISEKLIKAFKKRFN